MRYTANPYFELSPLDQIRQVEAEIARQIASARETGAQIITKTREEAKMIIKDAYATGNREGQKRYKEIVTAAEEEAQTVIAQTQNRAEFLKRRGLQRLESGTRQALHIILGLEDEEIDP
jgi:vacuolar-type H+-ATPase subunit H